jgi:hypothetical protein
VQNKKATKQKPKTKQSTQEYQNKKPTKTSTVGGQLISSHASETY